MRPGEGAQLLFVGGDGEQHQRRQQREPEHIADIGQAIFNAHPIHRKECAIDHAHHRQGGDEQELVLVGHFHGA